MYSPLPDGWDVGIRASGVRVATLDWYYSDSLALIASVPMESFQVTADRKATTRRTGMATIVDADFLAAVKADEVAYSPYGAEVVINCGLVNADGSASTIPIGRFVVEDVSWQEGDVAITITLNDRSIQLQRLMFQNPLSYALQTVEAAVTNLASRSTYSPTVTFDPAVPTLTIPGGTMYDKDAWGIITDLVALVAAEAYFDVAGNIQVVPIPTAPDGLSAGDEDWIVDAGGAGVLIQANRRISRTDTYNNVLVVGGPPASHTAGQFLEPNSFGASDSYIDSPTYINGPFGIQSIKYNIQEITDINDLSRFAFAQLANLTGLSKTLSLNSLMNPALQEGDIIRVVYPDSTEEFHLVDRVSFDQSWSSSINTRVKQGG